MRAGAAGLMDWQGLTPQQVSSELAMRMVTTRQRYDLLRGSQDAVEVALRGAVGSDGGLALSQARAIAAELLEALQAHRRAVAEFTAFALRGELPKS